MEREKEIFLEEEREQKLKDRQVFVNLTRDRPKEIVETEIIDETIPSPDTKRKDEERYKGHLRDSLLDEAQSEWEEKMQKRKDYAADNFDFAQKESDSIGSSPDLIATPDKQESKQIVSKPEVIVKSDDRTFTQNTLKKESDSSYIKSSQSSFNESHLRDSKEMDAQKEWEQKMRERPAHGEKAQEQGTSFDIDELGEKRDALQEKAINDAMQYTMANFARYQTNSITKILSSQKRVIQNGKDFLWRTSGGQTSTGRGIKETEENVMPFIQMAVDTTKRTLATSIAGNMHMDKDFQKACEILKAQLGEEKTLFSVDTSRAMTTDDFKKLQKGLQKYLKDKNIGIFSSKPKVLEFEINRAIKSGRLTIEEGQAAKVLNRRLGEIRGLSGKSNLFHLLRFGRRKLHKYGRQESTLNAMFMTGALLRHTKNVIQNILTIAQNVKFLVKNAAKLVSLAAAKASIKLSKTKLAKKVKEKLPDSVKKKHAERQKKKRERREKKARRKKRRREYKDFIDKVIDKVPHPARFVKNKIQHAKASVISFLTRGKYNPLRLLGKAFNAANRIKNMIIMAVSLVVLVYFIILIILLFLTSVGAKYSVESNSDKINEFCLKKIETLYKEQQKSLASYNENGAYRHVKIKKVDKKSNSMYNDDLGFTETTNTAEMMAMAQVYFDFDLDDASEEDIGAYLSGLYSGSHTMDIKEKDHYTKDKDGKRVLDYTDAEITVTTYYFDDLFDCVLGSSGMVGSESPIAGKEFTVPQTFKQSITYEGDMNWAFRVAKSASNPMHQVAEAWRKNGSKSGTAADGMENTPCIEVGGQKRYLCALVSHYAQIGDYVDAYLEDGTILPLILIDNKGCSDGQGYHNLQTNFIYQGFHYGHTLSPGNQSVCSVLELMKVHSGGGNPSSYCTRLKPVADSDSSSIKITKIVNGGSYLKNPSGPQYVNSGTNTTTGNTENATTFLNLLNTYSEYIKQNHKFFRRSNSKNAGTFSAAKSKVKDGDKVNVNCVLPTMWALKDMGLLAQGSNFYSTTDGKWHGINEKIKQKATIISSGDPIGMNVTKAAKKGLLQAGDIIANSSFNHTYVYAGYENGKILVYEAGGNANSAGYGKVGCGPFSAGQYNNLKIKSIIRWR